MRLPQDRILHIDTKIADGKVGITAEWQGELVRCKDCRHWKCNPNTNEYGVCNKVSCDEFEIVMHSDDFCSYGECKGGEDE